MQNYRAFTSRYDSQAQLALCMFHGKSAAVWWLPSGRMDPVEFEQIIWQRVWRNPAPQARGAPRLSGKPRGWPPFLVLLQLCAHSLRYCCLFCVTRALGEQEICPEGQNHPFTERTFRMSMFPEMTADLRKEIREQQNVKRKGPPRFGVLDHWLFPMRGPCFLQATAFTEPPCPLSLQSSLPGGKSLSLGGWENVRSQQRVE